MFRRANPGAGGDNLHIRNDFGVSGRNSDISRSKAPALAGAATLFRMMRSLVSSKSPEVKTNPMFPLTWRRRGSRWEVFRGPNVKHVGPWRSTHDDGTTATESSTDLVHLVGSNVVKFTTKMEAGGTGFRNGDGMKPMDVRNLAIGSLRRLKYASFCARVAPIVNLLFLAACHAVA
jgi:hypothetical protein